ncbi:MAG: Caleosin related protein-domain-containing protein [Monoraphidium minutum]|nr:MAG: Caleosin related protein-domain-containing protein [Monoraphidium minutum]
MDACEKQSVMVCRRYCGSGGSVASEERQAASRWSTVETLANFIEPQGWAAFYDQACTTHLDSAAAARAVHAVTLGEAAPRDLADVIATEPADGTNMHIMAVSYVRRVAADSAGSAASGALAGGAQAGAALAGAALAGAALAGVAAAPTPGSVGPARKKRKILPWHSLVHEALANFVPRQDNGLLLQERDGRGKTVVGRQLSVQQRVIVLESYPTAARWIAQQPAGADITDLSEVESKLKSVASNLNTKSRSENAEAQEERLRKAWRDGSSPLAELKRSFTAGERPSLWDQVKSKPTLASARAALMLNMAARVQQPPPPSLGGGASSSCDGSARAGAGVGAAMGAGGGAGSGGAGGSTGSNAGGSAGGSGAAQDGTGGTDGNTLSGGNGARGAQQLQQQANNQGSARVTPASRSVLAAEMVQQLLDNDGGGGGGGRGSRGGRRGRGGRGSEADAPKEGGEEARRGRRRHVAFFDRDGDGVLWPSDTYVGFRRIGFNRLISLLAVPFIHGSFSYVSRELRLGFPTVSGWLPDPFFRVFIKNMHRGKHGSDAEVYDTEGRFVPAKFEELFSKYDRTNKGGLSWDDLNAMIHANKNIVDPNGWTATRFEWWALWLLCADDDGVISKEKIRGQYDGSLWYQLADENERRWAARKEAMRSKWD